MKRKILGMFGLFLAVMLIFTLISRAADSVTIARVTTGKMEKGKIAHTVTGSGIVQANREQAVATLPGQTVKTIFVEEGQSVKKGDILFEIDLESLKEQILTQKQEMEKEELLSGDKASSRAAQEQKDAVEQSRAAEDYDTAVKNGNTAVSRAAQALEEARAKRAALENAGSEQNRSDVVEETLQKILEEKQEEYDLLVKKKEELETSIEEKVKEALEENNRPEEDTKLREETDGAAETMQELETAGTQKKDPQLLEQQIRQENQALLDEAQRLIEEKELEVQQAQEALNDYLNEKEANSRMSLDEIRQQADEEVKEKQQAYEDALESARQNMQGAKRAMEDASAFEGTDSTGRIDEITKEQAQLQLDKLEHLLETEGKVTSPIDGVVVRINLTTGDKTPDGTAVLLTDTASGKRLVVEVPANQSKYAAKNDPARVKADGRKQEWEDLTVDAVRFSEENKDILEVVVQLPSDSMDTGEAATLTVSRTSESYECCIPIQALHSDNGKYFVYVISEKNSILGKELTAQRIDVTVLDKNDINAALQAGDISSEQNIVLSSDKEISAGSRVRIDE